MPVATTIMASYITITVIVALCVDVVSGSYLTNRVFKWTHTDPVGYTSVGKELKDNWFYASNKKDVRLCAYQCLRNDKCQSFNYNKVNYKCTLNTKAHGTVLLSDAGTTDMSYHTKTEFNIDPEALGPCAGDVCNSHGRCLETKTTDDDLIALCICTKGWGGSRCDMPEAVPSWGAWQAWDDCSVTCDLGYRLRTRNCEDTSNGQTLSAMECYGRDIEYEACQMLACPRWDLWATWGLCTTYQTCGRGYKVRHRTCNNGGTPGVDRYCLGPTNETTVCYGMNCKGLMRLRGGSAYGEGRVELFNDLIREWGLVCGNEWTQQAADLVCKQLGMPGAFAATQDSRFGAGEGLYGVTSLTCTGSEKTVQMCERNPWSLQSSCPGITEPGGVVCKVNGVWSLWAEWGDCSVSCENGIRQRTRNCDHPPALHGGRACVGEALQTKPCTLDACPVDGKWRAWREWSPCSMSCGKGTQWRERTCQGPFHNGQDCRGESRQTQECEVRQCPVDGVWNGWDTWADCTEICGGGVRSRTRTCNGPSYQGSPCPGDSSETEECNLFECPVNGAWLPWHEWRDCSVTCGGGLQIRKRDCLKPKHGGSNCEGESQETRECQTQDCPVNASWKPWSDWEECNVTCGGGSQRRMRTCQEGLHGGVDCVGPSEDFQACNTHVCPVDGVWREWNEWSACSHRCDTGTQTRNRTCDGPYFGGKDCVGPSMDKLNCNTHSCAVDGIWVEWAKWSTCTLTCGGGTQWRTRNCIGPFDGGKDCEGPRNMTQDCNTQHCPIDGVWFNWGQWGPCNSTCGGGYMKRVRVCDAPKNGGADCEGDKQHLQSCNPNLCPIPGEWVTWLAWSACSITCGGGKKFRSRECNTTSYGDLTAPCEGPLTETIDCHTFSCTPLARTCSEWGNRGLTANTMADIDPDASGDLEPTRVYCDMTLEDGIGVTVIGHQAEEEQEVVGYEGAGEYVLEIEYNITLDHTIAVIEASASCKQFVQWRCRAALIHNPNGDGRITTGWRNRTGGIADYLGDAPPGSGMCTCGNDNTCVDELACNCDKNDDVWREDSGYLRYKDDLPVTEFMAGDTGDEGQEAGAFRLGPVECTGTSVDTANA